MKISASDYCAGPGGCQLGECLRDLPDTCAAAAVFRLSSISYSRYCSTYRYARPIA